ncbi:MAG: ribonuclease P protein component [Desulfamplus sp.]|nr:ribonuclease P protein component [Desulfamplus sp.]MBF0413558.1 ribonuclease P protein component [Desulfamplus sp.]
MGDNSFPKTDRILKRSQFVKLSLLGKMVQTRYFMAVILDGESVNNRIGITVSKKVGNAVERNRIKRIVREYYRHRKETISGNRDINIIARKYASHLPNAQVPDELDKLFRKISEF